MAKLKQKLCQEYDDQGYLNEKYPESNPFKSKRQRKYMYANHPGIAKRWSKKYGNKIQK